jgi:hypothetical protein
MFNASAGLITITRKAARQRQKEKDCCFKREDI